MPWCASGAPQAGHERCRCQVAGAHAAADKKLLVSQMATSNNVKKSKMSRQRLSESASIMVMVISNGDGGSLEKMLSVSEKQDVTEMHAEV